MKIDCKTNENHDLRNSGNLFVKEDNLKLNMVEAVKKSADSELETSKVKDTTIVKEDKCDEYVCKSNLVVQDEKTEENEDELAEGIKNLSLKNADKKCDKKTKVPVKKEGKSSKSTEEKSETSDTDDEFVSRAPIRNRDDHIHSHTHLPYSQFKGNSGFCIVQERPPALDEASHYRDYLGYDFPPKNYSDQEIKEVMYELIKEYEKNPVQAEHKICQSILGSEEKYQEYGSHTATYSIGSPTASYLSSPLSSPAQSPPEYGASSPEYSYSDGNLTPPHYHYPNWPYAADSEVPVNNNLIASTVEKSTHNYVISNNQCKTADRFQLIKSVSPSVGTFNTPSPKQNVQSMRERFANTLDPAEKKKAWITIFQKSIEDLGRGDADGDSQLMILLCQLDGHKEHFIFHIVERLKKEKPEYLVQKNVAQQDALFLAGMFAIKNPLIAGYIAESLVETNQNVNVKYENGLGLLHCLAEKGDKYHEIFEILCQVRKPNGEAAFDLNMKNTFGYTPLHLAIKLHSTNQIENYKIVKTLLDYKVDLFVKEHKNNNTVLHTLIQESADPILIEMLLEASKKFSKEEIYLTWEKNRQANTPLHIACSRNDLPLDSHLEILRLILSYGGDIQSKNLNGNVPAVLASSDRKQIIRTLLREQKQK